jgi:hypothetical protein
MSRLVLYADEPVWAGVEEFFRYHWCAAEARRVRYHDTHTRIGKFGVAEAMKVQLRLTANLMRRHHGTKAMFRPSPPGAGGPTARHERGTAPRLGGPKRRHAVLRWRAVRAAGWGATAGRAPGARTGARTGGRGCRVPAHGWQITPTPTGCGRASASPGVGLARHRRLLGEPVRLGGDVVLELVDALAGRLEASRARV